MILQNDGFEVVNEGQQDKQKSCDACGCGKAAEQEHKSEVYAVNQKQPQQKGACLCCDECRQHGTGAKRNVVRHEGHINRKHKGQYP